MTLWLTLTARRYEAANRTALGWMLARPPLGPFLDTKVNPLTGADYGPGDGQRGPGWTHGWIQGRGLEALVSFARDLAESDPALSAHLLDRARPLYAALDGLVARDGHGAFLYRDGRPVQPVAGDVCTYSDAFFAKGLVAAAALFAPEDLPRHLDYLARVIAAIEEGRFQIDESLPIGPEALATQADDFGPRMILLGAAGMLHCVGLDAHTGFADRFIAHVLHHHHDPDGLQKSGGRVVMMVQDIGFSLHLLGKSKAEIAAAVTGTAQIFGLSDLLDRYPRQLSGSQRQRVAMGRAIVRQPKVFLFDDLLTNLDAKLRVQMRPEHLRPAPASQGWPCRSSMSSPPGPKPGCRATGRGAR